MRPEVQARLEPFFRTVALSPHAVLMLDYDGTLAPFRTRRDQAFPYPGVALLLQEIVRNGRTRVLVISGRDVADLLPLLNIHPRPEMWGVHGLQRMRTDGTTEIPELGEAVLNALSDADRWLSYQQLRHRAEFKPGGIAVHWRGCAELMVEDIRSRVLLGWRLIAERGDLNLLEFDGGIEIRAREADKGDAVRAFLQNVPTGTPIAYLGDDTTDEAAFRALGGHGTTILVRPEIRETAAQLWLRPPEEIVDFLGFWLKSCIQGSAFEGGAARAVNG